MVVWLLCFASCYLRWWWWVSGLCSRAEGEVSGRWRAGDFPLHNEEPGRTQHTTLRVACSASFWPTTPNCTQDYPGFWSMPTICLRCWQQTKPELCGVQPPGRTVPRDREQIMTTSWYLNTVYVFLTGPLSAPCRVWQHHSLPATSWDNPLQQTCWMLSRVSKETILHRSRHSHIFHSAYSRAFFHKFPCSLWSEWWRNTDHLVTENIWTTYNITHTHYPSSFLSQNI